MPYDEGGGGGSPATARRTAYLNSAYRPERRANIFQERRRWLGAARGGGSLSATTGPTSRRYLSQVEVGMLAPNLRPEWTKRFYERGGQMYFDPAHSKYSETLGLGRQTNVALQPIARGLPGVIGHEAGHATLRQAFGGLPNQLLMFGGAVNALLQPGRALRQGPLEAMRSGALEWSEAPAYQLGGPGRSGYLEDIPPLLRPLFSGIVRTKSGA